MSLFRTGPNTTTLKRRIGIVRSLTIFSYLMICHQQSPPWHLFRVESADPALVIPFEDGFDAIVLLDSCTILEYQGLACNAFVNSQNNLCRGEVLVKGNEMQGPQLHSVADVGAE